MNICIFTKLFDRTHLHSQKYNLLVTRSTVLLVNVFTSSWILEIGLKISQFLLVLLQTFGGVNQLFLSINLLQLHHFLTKF